MTLILDFSSDVEMTLFPISEEDEIIQNLYCLMNTTIGEVPCYREFGMDKSYLSAPMNISKTMLVSAIADAMANFFPNMRLDNVDFDVDSDQPDTFACRVEVTDDE